MKKLVTMFVFLAITGWTTACGASPVDVGEIDLAGVPDPNGFYSPPDAGEIDLAGVPDPNG